MCWKTAVRAPLSWTIQIRTEWPIISAALGKIGARVLGLNWRLTAPETRYVLENSGARAIILDDPDRDRMADHQRRAGKDRRARAGPQLAPDGTRDALCAGKQRCARHYPGRSRPHRARRSLRGPRFQAQGFP